MIALALALLMPAPEVVFETPAPIRSAIATNGEALFFGSEDCRFRAVDAASGDELWSIATGQAVQSVPVVTDGRVVFNAANTLYIADARDGALTKVVYPAADTLRVSDDDWAWNDSSATVRDNRAWFAALDGDIVEVDTGSGEMTRIHKAQNRGNVASGVNFEEGRLLWVDRAGELVGLDVATWREVFRTPVGDRIFAPVTIADGRVYLAGRNCRMTCVDLSSGEVLWSVYSKDPTTWFSGGSVVVGDTLWATTSDEFTIMLTDAKTGALKKLLPIHTNGYTRPVLRDGVIAVVATDVYRLDRTDITFFDTATESVIHHEPLKDASFSSPVSVGGALFFGSESGRLYRVSIDK